MLSTVYRKSKNGAILSSRWLRYLYSNKNKPFAFHDFKNWALSTFIVRDLTKLEIPWITFPAIRWLDQHLTSEMTIFEWGSGASTLYFAKRSKKVISIECSEPWVKIVQTKLLAQRLNNVDLKFIAPEGKKSNGFLINKKEEKLYQSEAPSFSGKTFINYAKSITQYPDNYFDLVMVDGFARTGCLALAQYKVKDGGALILDNSEREHYKPALSIFNSPTWTINHFPGPCPNSYWPAFTRTTIFIKAFN